MGVVCGRGDWESKCVCNMRRQTKRDSQSKLYIWRQPGRYQLLHVHAVGMGFFPLWFAQEDL